LSSFTDVSGELLDSTDLPLIPPTPEEAQISRWFIVFNDTKGGPQLSISGPLSVHAVVPDSSTLWLFGSGLLGLVGATRRKKH